MDPSTDPTTDSSVVNEKVMAVSAEQSDVDTNSTVPVESKMTDPVEKYPQARETGTPVAEPHDECERATANQRVCGTTTPGIELSLHEMHPVICEVPTPSVTQVEHCVEESNSLGITTPVGVVCGVRPLNLDQELKLALTGSAAPQNEKKRKGSFRFPDSVVTVDKRIVKEIEFDTSRGDTDESN